MSALACLALAPAAPAAAPSLGDAWSSQVFSASARLAAEVNPGSAPTTYHFDYITQVAYEANLAAAKDPFAGASRAPAGSDASAGAGATTITVTQLLFNLAPETAYRYRIVVKNTDDSASGPSLTFLTRPLAGESVPAGGRGWEMVSPVDKNGGRVDPPGALAGGGDLQAAAQGGAFTYGSAASFAGGQGAPPASQYLATRTTSGWATENLTAPLFSGTYDTESGGVPYRLFSEELSRALLLNGHHCRGEASGCAVANPPLPGSDAPAGYQNYYLREAGAYQALLGPTEIARSGIGAAEFEVSLAGAAPDLRHLVLSSCAALLAAASDGCGGGAANLYEFSQGTGLSLINSAPGAALGAPAGAISADGQRVYFTQAGNLYLREGTQLAQPDLQAGGGGTFEAASADGSLAYFSKAGHLYRYSAAADTATDLTPAGGLLGVLGASADGAAVYYQDAAGLRLRQGETTTTIAAGAGAADPANWPAASGTARLSADGAKLLFVSTAPLTGYDNTDLATKAPDSQVYLYDSAAGLACLSCNPTSERPVGRSSVPGALENGDTSAYKPRALSADGRRAFFDSADALVPSDTNNDTDVYQWQAQGEGSCAAAGGCLGLISSGRASEGASFVDASADGSDAFFLTTGSLVGSDPGSLDLYDARIGGGFGEAPAPIPCQGDACQVLPPEPTDPTLTTVLAGPGNPKVHYSNYPHKKKCQRASKKQGAKCAKPGKAKEHRGRR
ncbi:MAG TPA: hypothetical protein VN758_08355 [Solirubrobacterales bacterium]|nr:hypothetical protein [Solirubrobacterales bacterium]